MERPVKNHLSQRHVQVVPQRSKIGTLIISIYLAASLLNRRKHPIYSLLKTTVGLGKRKYILVESFFDCCCFLFCLSSFSTKQLYPIWITSRSEYNTGALDQLSSSLYIVRVGTALLTNILLTPSKVDSTCLSIYKTIEHSCNACI